jgi:hypothetical protein
MPDSSSGDSGIILCKTPYGNSGREKDMKNHRPDLITLSLLFLMAIAQPSIAQLLESFSAVADNHSVRLEWSTVSESGVTGFRIMRSIDGRNFYRICDVEPAGAGNAYQYIDNDLFKDNTRTFYYRLEICLTGGRKIYSQIAEATLSFSGVQRTWGSLKAMFR